MLILKRKEKNLIKTIARRYSLELILFFGSRLQGEKYLHKESDFDIAYLSKKNLDLMQEARLTCDLMPLFKSEKIDLVNLKKANPLLMHQIFANHKVLYCKDLNKYLLYKIYGMRKYIEAKPLFELTAKSINKFLKANDK